MRRLPRYVRHVATQGNTAGRGRARPPRHTRPHRHGRQGRNPRQTGPGNAPAGYLTVGSCAVHESSTSLAKVLSMAHRPSVTKAVIPAAGLGTRFVPATKAMPKEMLPVIDTPAIQYVVEEAAAAGLIDVLMVTARGKTNIEDHFDRNVELEEVLAAKGDESGLASILAQSNIASMHYVRQLMPLGLGHAVLLAADHVGNEPFAVLLGDDFIDRRDPLLPRMLEARQRYGGSILALMEVEPEQVSSYGVATIKPTDEDDIVAVTDLVEKPPVGEAPSNWIVLGRYVCDPSVFDALRDTQPGRGGEIQLTDALRTLARTDRTSSQNGASRDGALRDGGGVHGVLFRGRRYDTGNKVSYLQTLVRFACERPDVAPEFVPWLLDYVQALKNTVAGADR
jgi:UTP--glucose-1-phosphate uridylyltransferase